MATKISLESLLAEARSERITTAVNAKGLTLFSAERHVVQGPNYADTDGFHIYTHIRLRLRLSSAEEDEHAARLLEIIQLAAKLAEDCGRVAGVEHLEIQGKRSHFLLPCKMNDEESMRRLLAFSIALARVVEAEVQPLAGDDWVGFAMSADHGRAILVSSRPFDASDSLISLGPAANAPAKKLNRPVNEGGVPDGCLAVNMACHGRPSDPEARPWWKEFDLAEPLATLREDVDRLTERMLAAIHQDVLLFNAGAGGRGRRTVHLAANSAEFVDVSAATFKDPRKVQGFAVRVDLDGFTAQVRDAFRAGDDRAIVALVERFNEILTYPRQFKDRMDRPMILLPWAGDQANMILLPRPGETYADARGYLAAEAARIWHRQEFDDVAGTTGAGRRRAWAEALGGAKWVLGWAGGDDEGGGDGHSFLLVANVHAGGRGFLTASGWGWGRALDAQEADYVRAEDTVLPHEDYHALDSVYQRGFSRLDTRFYRAPYRALEDAAKEKTSAMASSRPAVLAGPAILVRPAPRPYAMR